ncbi:MAG: glycerophosphodiester phosphodiesterase family protein [Bacilli bacterium]|jgi:glycerophosphoryl diester phosphodiesterase|nr:glycerophosphodiester phosphodiesterase family protein [Bacilli bacterium]
MKKFKIILRFGIVIVLLFWIVVVFLPRPQSVAGVNPLRIQDDEKPILIAHGGGNKEFPDNTLEAFYHAYSIDPNCMLETDVSITKDNVIILSHDIMLDRKTTLQNALIEEMNYSDLIADEVDFNYQNAVNEEGYRTDGNLVKYNNYLGEEVSPLDVVYPAGILPRHDTVFLATTLEELIIAFPNNLINVEIKQGGEVGLKALREVIFLMDQLDSTYHTFERIVLASFHKDIYQALVDYKTSTHPELLFSPEASNIIQLLLLHYLKLDWFYRSPVSVLQLPVKQSNINLATKAFIATAHKHNIAVHYWTIDDEETMRMLIKNKADGIMTNIPSLLKQVLAEE